MGHRAAAVASRAIELAVRGQPFSVNDIQRGIEDAPSRQTIYRVLQQLEADDWITGDGHTYRPDFKAEALGDVDDSESGRKRFDISAEDVL